MDIMENYTAYRNIYLDLRKSAYAETDQLPLMSNPEAVGMILAAYLAFVLKIGPGYMRKREPNSLKNTILVYNAAQVVISVYLVQRFFRNVFLEWGIAPSKCVMNDEHSRNEVIFGIWLYLVVKVTELLDTVFFVLRKKDNQVTFLHTYHHFIMVAATWSVLKYWPTHTVIFIGFLNSLVHVFMYTYYGLAGLGPQVAKYLTWKKYMTVFQLVQFVLIILHCIVSVNVSDCPPTKEFASFVTCNTGFFLLLFWNFYKRSYKEKKN